MRCVNECPIAAELYTGNYDSALEVLSSPKYYPSLVILLHPALHGRYIRNSASVLG